MDSIPERLVKIEEDAKKIVLEARESKIGTNDYLEKQKADIEAAFFAEADKTIKANYEAEMRKQREEIIEAEEQVKIKIGHMKKFYEDNKAEWIREVFDNIIGR